MKIARIEKAKNYRIFRDFTWPATGIPEFGQFNVIYGWNGSGKTTLSNIFHMIQRRTPLLEGQVELLVDQTIVKGKDFDTASLPAVRTFNRDTVDRSVFEAPNRQLPPVFFLGEDTVEKQREVEQLSKELRDLAEAQKTLDAKSKTVATTFEAFCTEEARGTKNLLTVAGGGPYNNYNAGNFRTDAAALAKQTDIVLPLIPKVRKAYEEMKDERSMAVIAEPLFVFPDVAALVSQTGAMLSKSVVSTVIAELADDREVGAWVRTGLPLHKSPRDSQTCRFCNQGLPQGRIAALEAHFNDEFQRFISEVDGLVGEVVRAKEALAKIEVPPKEALYANLRPAYEKAANASKQNSLGASGLLDILIRALRAKRDEPFKQLVLTHFVTNLTADGSAPSVLEAVAQYLGGGAMTVGAILGKTNFDRLVSLIKEHNARTSSFDAEVVKVRAGLLRDETLRAMPRWRELTKEIADLAVEAEKVREQVGKLRPRIDALNAEIRQHRQPAEELNKEIAAYLGRDELQFRPEQNGYLITRGGHPATDLSDGERTAIAFLYFLKSLKAADFDLTKGIVVIDDPVSSLDANSMFSAFAFLKQRTASAAQLFVLTHNFSFFRQVRAWFYGLRGPAKKEARF